ncbi:MAG: 50S ribosomal protein L4 [Candidatus Uhrbacteria bacterium]|nr:50S ribosomal protein L4 [Candidatus Uhrbacteria bacterium]
MAQVNVYKIDGSKSGTMDLPEGLFGVKVKSSLVHEAIIAQVENGRIRIANTKDRSEVRGGGRKPWKQKGTGRARHGSSRSPIWIGGGVTFGPTILRVFGKKINKKARKGALAMILSDKVASDLLVAIEDISAEDMKTKTVAQMRNSLPGAGKKALIVTTADEKAFVRAARNVKDTETISAGSLNVRDIAKYPYVLASKAAIEQIIKNYAR